MTNHACYLVTEKNEFESALLPEEKLAELVNALRENGGTEVHFASRSVTIQGIYIPAKGSKVRMMVLPELEGEE